MKKLVLLFLLIDFSACAQKKITWPDHKKAVIVLTYDDALKSQLDNAVPALDSAGFKATFFLTGDIGAQTIPRWRALAKEGHELANHTLYHPCSVKLGTPVASEHYTPYTIIREIEMMNNFLFAVDGQTSRTYAYPCAETTVGGKDYVDTLRRYSLVKYARVSGDINAVITNFSRLDPLRVHSWGLEENTPAEKLIEYVKNVKEKGGMGIFMFHGISGEYINTSAAAHRALINYLKQDKDIWVTTFQQAMDYVSKHK